ncbi:hypothetical protein [Nonomuraea solani]|uniref:hypothetical protein n=1 Tax=Nonomuraea solani TaxID=1144553 RepID=UPI0013587FEF|nr:hypothetical protein [Nonomuraea solani]
MDTRAERIALFLAVRNVPYATDGAHDAETLMVYPVTSACRLPADVSTAACCLMV